MKILLTGGPLHGREIRKEYTPFKIDAKSTNYFPVILSDATGKKAKIFMCAETSLDHFLEHLKMKWGAEETMAKFRRRRGLLKAYNESINYLNTHKA